MAKHEIIWTEPSPFWGEAFVPAQSGDRALFLKPTILRFAKDEFMQEFMNVVATDPLRLGEYRVRPETWRGIAEADKPIAPAKIFALPFQRLGNARRRVANGVTLATKPRAIVDALVKPESKLPLKLYQPAHQRFYLLTACLVCQTSGLPDRKVDAGKHERAAFVIRRLFPDNTPGSNHWSEHAWVSTPNGFAWKKLSSDDEGLIQPDEERLPFFGVNFTEDDRRRRRLFAGIVPVGKREAYMGAPAATSNTPGEMAKTARKVLLRAEVIEPWKNLVSRATMLSWTTGLQLKTERDRIQSLSWYVLLDFSRFIQKYLPNIYDVIRGKKTEDRLVEHEPELFNAIKAMEIGTSLQGELSGVVTSFVDALRRIADFEEKLDAVTSEYSSGPADDQWPDFLFPLADPGIPQDAPTLPDISLTVDESVAVSNEETEDETATEKWLDGFAALVVRALRDSGQSQPAVPTAAIAPHDTNEGWFVMRCVYERPACGPLHDDVVSKPTEPFQMAGFFDPDAPARPIRIGLPIDTTPAGLRKFNKNTAFVMSDVLCGQIKRMKGLTFGDLILSVLPFPLHQDLPVGAGAPCKTPGGANIGTICSLSIPIITICALILLMIMVALLDIIFKWMPFFMLCFPAPNLSAKIKAPSPP